VFRQAGPGPTPRTAALVVLGLPFLARTDLAALSPAAWGGVAYAGVLAIGVAYLLWYWGVQRIGSARTSVFSNLVPVVALVVAWAWIGETPTALQLAGAAVVLGGMTLARLVRRGGGRGGHPGEGSPRDAGAPGR
jgi:drug/metabolite transporter (DMT)-like permease